MAFGKKMGEFFRPRNIFSRGARVGGSALGGVAGGPEGAKMGYQLGDKLAGTWEKDDSEKSGFENMAMRGKMSGMSGDSGSIMNLFSRNQNQAPEPSISFPGEQGGGADVMQILNLLKMSGKL